MKYEIVGAFAIPKCETTSSDRVTYIGPNLPCTDIRNNSDLTTAIEKLDAKICELLNMYYSVTCAFAGVVSEVPGITTTTTTTHL